jgi:hypothetical protein
MPEFFLAAVVSGGGRQHSVRVDATKGIGRSSTRGGEPTDAAPSALPPQVVRASRRT